MVNLNLYTHMVECSVKDDEEPQKVSAVNETFRDVRDTILERLKLGNYPEGKGDIAKMFD
jgi:hypothetical protein